MDLQLLLVPYDSGQRDVRMGAGPQHLCAAGLEQFLIAQGHSVTTDFVEPKTAGWRAEIQTAFELLRALSVRVRAARGTGRFPVILSGNCNVAGGIVAGLGPKTGVIWFDAHGDFNTPETTTTGFLDGMALAMLTGRCWRSLSETIENFQAVPGSSLLLLGARDLDDAEEAALTQAGIRRLSAADATKGLKTLLQAMTRGVSQFYVHLDLDSLDPKEGRANGYSAPDGFTRQGLLASLGTIKSSVDVCALTVSAYDPSYDKSGTVQEAAFAAISTIVSGVSTDRQI
jgi:arginase